MLEQTVSRQNLWPLFLLKGENFKHEQNYIQVALKWAERQKHTKSECEKINADICILVSTFSTQKLK